jgi:hypothetical protein
MYITIHATTTIIPIQHNPLRGTMLAPFKLSNINCSPSSGEGALILTFLLGAGAGAGVGAGAGAGVGAIVETFVEAFVEALVEALVEAAGAGVAASTGDGVAAFASHVAPPTAALLRLKPLSQVESTTKEIHVAASVRHPVQERASEAGKNFASQVATAQSAAAAAL